LPLVVASVLAARSAGLTRAAVGLGAGVSPVQLAIVALGIPLGFVPWLVAPSFLWAAPGTPLVQVAVAAVLLGVFVGVIEEAVFRGVIQAGLTITYARGAVPLTAILYGAVYLGSFSIVTAVWMTFVGCLYGVIVQQSRSIVGTAVSHALLVASGLVVFPAIGVRP
jgi:membrane protease YdiL (CAAX protease family)